MTNYSIIIPHKNIPELLEKCLNSIPHRKDIQIIVVDDKSSNENIEKLKKIEKKLTYIEIIYTTKGKGAGYARNIGIKQAKGKWLIFADADDEFTNDFETQLNKFVNDDSNVIKFYFIRKALGSYTDEEKRQYNLGEIKYPYDGTVWSRFIKREFVEKNQIKCQETQWGNDTYFSFALDYYEQTPKLEPTTIYCYNFRRNSLYTSPTNKSILCRIKVFYTVCKLYKDREKEEQLINVLTNYWKQLVKKNTLYAIKGIPYICKYKGLRYIINNIPILNEIKNCIIYPRYFLGKIKKGISNN